MVAAGRCHTVQTGSLIYGYAVAGLFWGAFAASTPDLQAISGLNTGGFGFLLLVMTAGAFPAMMLLGRVIHRLQVWAMPICLGCFGLATGGFGLASDIASLGIALFLAGAASGALDIALNMRVSTIEADSGARLFNRAHAMFPLALLVASPLTGVARDAGAGPGEIFPFLGLLFASAAALEAYAGRAQVPAAERPAPRPIRLGAVLVTLAGIAALGAFMEMSAQNWSVIFVEAVLETSSTIASLAAAAFTLGLSIGRLTAHRIEARSSDAMVIRIAALLGALAFLTIAFGGTLPVVFAGFLAAGIAVGPVEPTVYRIVAGRYGPAERGRALSAVTAVAYLGYLISPPILGSIAQRAGWPVMWAAVAVIAIAVASLTVTFVRLERRATAQGLVGRT